MSDWGQWNPGLVYQIYGLSFFVLGVLAYVLPRHDDSLRFARHLWLLAAFGILHGTLEFVEWHRLQRDDPWLAGLADLLLTLSYVPLLEFGRRSLMEVPRARLRLNPLLVYGAAGLAVAAPAVAAGDSLAGLAAGARYFIGAPGALLAGAALLALRQARARRIDVAAIERGLPMRIMVIGGALLAYGLLTPWPSAPAAGLPDWLPTSGDFLAATGIPVELLRALCAIAAAVGLMSLVRHAGSRSSDDLLRVLGTIDGFVYRCRNTPDWPLVYMAGNVEELGGYRIEDFLDPNTVSMGSWIHPQDRQSVWNAVQASLQTRRPFEISYRIIARDGTERWVHERGQGIHGEAGELLYLQGHVMDASALVAANEELRRERSALRGFRNTLDLMLDGVFMLDPETLRFTYVNQGALDQTGYSREELLNLHAYDIKPDLPEPRFRQLIEPLRDGSLPSLRFETPHRRRDGTDIPVEVFLQYVTPEGESPRFVAVSHDITQRMQNRDALMKALAELRESEHRQAELLSVAQREQSRMAALLSGMSIGILFEDRDERVEYVNPAFRRMWAIPEAVELVGRPSRDVLEHSTHRFARPDHASRHILHVLDTHEISERFEVDLYDGRILTQLSYPVPDPDGRIIGRLWIYEDVTHERQTAQQLIYLAEHDALTGLHNRHRFQQHLEQVIQRSRRADRRFALLYFDLDEFKYINDTFGHRAGDTVLVRAAGEVASLVRGGEIFARLGGDEFALLIEMRPGDDPVPLAERIIHAISAIPFRFRGSNLRLTASIGIACYPEHGDNTEDLVAHADAAMYQAKDSGKNTWAVYDATRNTAQAMVERMTWRSRIAKALERDRLELHFQGIYHTRDGSLSHLEALVRMRDPLEDERVIMPGQFIPVAEKTGQVLEIDRWVIKRSIKTLAAHPDLPALSINISGRSLEDPGLPHYIHGELEKRSVDPKRLIIELTETAAVVEMQDAQRFMEALQHTGCLICLDDFGSGFSTFAYLKYLNVQILKIDGIFIRDLPNNRDNQAFVKAMIDVARGLDKVTVAEFVEDGATLDMLREFGVDMAQGYHLDRPCADHPRLGGG
ncbi:sensor domain-containing protein [Thioalkalivibrio thiocyanodenitrificans]|uniref:sensor domain-containing protein n=1 Tax=Thioalkalivibrio thiocyanodenitrificans TaxID=243063 RepID=UPI0003737077|nr:EAL domain-containing protein [Thioalkalivibrio thiocyanodenitrificans]